MTEEKDMLDHVPPTSEIPESTFGQYVPDGVHPVKILGWEQNQASPSNVWVRAKVTNKDVGEHSMNLYVPTKEELNRRKQDTGSREGALKGFFHYKSTLNICGIPLEGITIRDALNKMVGWEGDAQFETSKDYGTRIKGLVKKQALPEAPPADVSDVPF